LDDVQGAEALAQTPYPFCCLLCGWAPSILFFDANKKTNVDLRHGWQHTMKEGANQVNIDQFWLDVEQAMVTGKDSSSKIYLNSIGMLHNCVCFLPSSLLTFFRAFGMVMYMFS